MLDDDDTSITAGSIVTVQVYLKRQMMEVLFDKEDLAHVDEEHDNLAIANEETESNKDQVGGDKAWGRDNDVRNIFSRVHSAVRKCLYKINYIWHEKMFRLDYTVLFSAMQFYNSLRLYNLTARKRNRRKRIHKSEGPCVAKKQKTGKEEGR